VSVRACKCPFYAHFYTFRERADSPLRTLAKAENRPFHAGLHARTLVKSNPDGRTESAALQPALGAGGPAHRCLYMNEPTTERKRMGHFNVFSDAHRSQEFLLSPELLHQSGRMRAAAYARLQSSLLGMH
jgi:hypothetical protein